MVLYGRPAIALSDGGHIGAFIPRLSGTYFTPAISNETRRKKALHRLSHFAAQNTKTFFLALSCTSYSYEVTKYGVGTVGHVKAGEATQRRAKNKANFPESPACLKGGEADDSYE